MRLDRFMAETRPEFEPDDAQMYLDLYRDADPEDAFDHFEEQRENNIEFLRNLPAGAGDRQGGEPPLATPDPGFARNHQTLSVSLYSPADPSFREPAFRAKLQDADWRVKILGVDGLAAGEGVHRAVGMPPQAPTLSVSGPFCDSVGVGGVAFGGGVATGIQLTWTAAPNATAYDLLRDGQPIRTGLKVLALRDHDGLAMAAPTSM
jgi:hypothetical protein